MWEFFQGLDALAIPKTKKIVSLILLWLLLLALTSCQTMMQPMPSISAIIPLAWEGYQRQFISADGRVVRPRNQNDTVSEGQAYAMLIAVVLDDRQTFDRVFDWTKQHLSRFRRFGDHLLAWHWEAGHGVRDWNSASDANVDLALALFLAHARWQDEGYRIEALHLLDDILALETATIAGGEYLLPGNWRLDQDVWILNPSYFSPAHFRLFYGITGDVRWKELFHSTYTFLSRLPHQNTVPVRAGLVPDWIAIDSEGHVALADGFSQHSTWDAVRMPWRIALDVLWGEDDCGLAYAQSIVNFWEQEWEQRTQQFFLEYRLNGQPLKAEEQVGVYAMTLPALQSVQSPLAAEVMKKVQRLFHPDGQYFQHDQEYYQHSLSLLGLLSLRPSESSNIPSLIQELQKFSLDHHVTCPKHSYSFKE